MGSQKSKSAQLPRSGVIVPLYMYPSTSETWEPLHKAIRLHPHLQFIVVLNPNSGPGAPPWWPEPSYVREIPRLNEYANVRTLGYVRTDYCRRPIQEVIGDIVAYGQWAEDRTNSGTFVRGVFFDETPNHYDSHSAGYLAKLTAEVRTTTGFSGPRLVMHNPGTVPDERLVARSMPDLTAVSEESLARYRSYTTQELARLDSWERSRTCIILHTCTISRKEIQALVRELRPRASYLFISELGPGLCYQEWAPGWDHFIRAMTEP